MISYIVQIVFGLIYLDILIVVLLSWIPIFNTKKEPLAFLVRVYNKIMAPFKAVIPPIGMVDISPLIAFILLQILENFLLIFLRKFGL